MSRMTMKNESGEFYPRRYEDGYGNTVVLSNEDCINKLGHYEDLEDEGRLIELPCLPNEEVWESHKRFGTHKTMYASREAIVGAIEAGYVIGYTKEEAEEKLAEMEGAE